MDIKEKQELYKKLRQQVFDTLIGCSTETAKSILKDVTENIDSKSKVCSGEMLL